MPSQNKENADDHEKTTRTQEHPRNDNGQTRDNATQIRITRKRKIEHKKPNEEYQQPEEFLTYLNANGFFVTHHETPLQFRLIPYTIYLSYVFFFHKGRRPEAFIFLRKPE
jgi:hypothetical protein